ncbi:hypothetical protein BSKO_13584 [Bryopsis sp. KO-2023]|nr:hypothetical protein BSKO_13584 [Bryopsis sp. KO-2023]
MVNGRHPLGIQPWGNSLLSDQPGDIKKSGLGSMSVLADELVLEILGLLDAKSLIRLSLVSKALYVFANYDESWRARVLEEFEGGFKFNESWRITYLSLRFPGTDMRSKTLLQVDGFFSDLLYQPWFCANVVIPDAWLEVDNIDRVSGISVSEFRERFEVPNRPVIIQDVASTWPAFKSWNRQYLSKAFSGKKIVAGNYDMDFEGFLTYCDSQNDEMPLYLFDKKFVEKSPMLGKDYRVPEYFQEDFFSVLGASARPDYRWIIIGPERSGSSFHKDPNSTSAWNAVIKGKKKWILFPPNITPPGVHPSQDGADVATSVSLIEWFLNFYEQTKNCEVKPVECIVNSGELIFVPRGWWHLALNLEESTAITQNFVSSVNLPHVLKFLKSGREDLVSGRPHEEREGLYRDFVSKLREHGHGDLLDELESKELVCKPRLLSIFDKAKTVGSEPNQKAACLGKDPVSTSQPFKFNFL